MTFHEAQSPFQQSRIHSAATLSSAGMQGHKAFEHHSSSRLDNHEGETVRHSYGSNPRNFHRGDRRTLQVRHSTRDVTQALSSALANVSTKELADASGSSLRAAENAKSGINAMCLAHFLSACREIPELKAMALEFMGCEPVNPDRERALALLVNSYVRGGA